MAYEANLLRMDLSTVSDITYTVNVWEAQF